jgi:hypothetical protein
MPRLELGAGDALALLQGRAVVVSAPEGGRYRCYGPEGFVGVAETRDGVLRAVRMLRPGADALPQGAGHSLES